MATAMSACRRTGGRLIGSDCASGPRRRRPRLLVSACLIMEAGEQEESPAMDPIHVQDDFSTLIEAACAARSGLGVPNCCDAPSVRRRRRWGHGRSIRIGAEPPVLTVAEEAPGSLCGTRRHLSCTYRELSTDRHLDRSRECAHVRPSPRGWPDRVDVQSRSARSSARAGYRGQPTRNAHFSTLP
jgi:hypothetical protein